MTEQERTVVLERLREMEGWASYIVEALMRNRKSEAMTNDMLKRSVPPELLREIREASWALYAKLHRINVQLEHARGEPEAVSAPIP